MSEHKHYKSTVDLGYNVKLILNIVYVVVVGDDGGGEYILITI